MFEVTTLRSGLKVLTSTMKGTEAITTLVMCGAGSRYEDRNINGVAHFLEHMFFKGAKKYKNAAEVAFAVDSVGSRDHRICDFNGTFGVGATEQFLRSPFERQCR